MENNMKNNHRGLESRILTLVQKESRHRPLDAGEISTSLGLHGKQRAQLHQVLEDMVQQGRIVRIRKGRYAAGQSADLFTGKLTVVRSGNGYVDPIDKSDDVPSVFVSSRDMGTALTGDTVVARLNPQNPGDEQGASGKIIQVVQRGRHEIVGTLRQAGRFLHVVPLAPGYGQNFFVAEAKGANLGDRVLLRFVNWENKHVSPEGEITEVLGPAEEPSVDTLSIIRQHDLPDQFPEAVLREAEDAAERMALPGKRVDLRSDLIITIDPERSRDFDDALSLQQDGEHRVLGVHIADVSHFVQPGSELDREAYARGTSVYLPDRVLPMLPEQLSNGICSLNPGKERLAFSVMLKVDRAGKVLERWFAKSLIQSSLRLTYEQAFAVLESRKPEGIEIPAEISKLIRDLHDLAQQFRQRRYAVHALDLDMPEVEIVTDGTGCMTGIRRVANDVSHQLVEECMVAANEAVAAELAARNIANIARYHEEPKEEKIEALTMQLLDMGYTPGDLRQRANMARFLRSVKEDPLSHHVYLSVLKSMNRAMYSATDTGHYGLAKHYYAHFTSPIRRYPDLVAHRLLGKCLSALGGEGYPKARLSEISRHASEREQVAALAERDLTEIMKFRYLEREQKQTPRPAYDAVIVTVAHYGAFVELVDLQVQGLVHISALSTEFLRYHRGRSELINRRNRYKVGDAIRVHVEEVDFDARRVTFVLEEVVEG
jgi:ribonuclease R